MRTWLFCNAQEFKNKKVGDITSGGSSIGCTSAGDVTSEKSASYCDSAYEYSYTDQPFTAPQGSLYSMEMRCVVEGNNWGWAPQLLRSGEGENYLILNCGIDADCPPDKYCRKMDISSPTTYYCASRCGNGVCEPNENCPQDSQGAEACDGADNNCNGVIDDGLAISCLSDSTCPANGCYQGTYRNYRCSNPGSCSSRCEFNTLATDADSDGYDTQCDNDCNDGDSGTHPGAIELCDGRDNNCDGAVPADEKDADHDGMMACSGDCNDNNAAISSNADETCGDGIDNNCNGIAEEGCCASECSAGEARCSGSSAQTCGNYDSDSCLEWPADIVGEGSEQCGNDSYGEWSESYCSGKGVVQNRTFYLRGCSIGACFSSAGIEFRSVENCSYVCAGGSCARLRGDANNDCVVDIFDLAATGLAYGSAAGGSNWNPDADFNGDSAINIFDLATVGISYGGKC